jgi:hypothetical protein
MRRLCDALKFVSLKGCLSLAVLLRPLLKVRLPMPAMIGLPGCYSR